MFSRVSTVCRRLFKFWTLPMMFLLGLRIFKRVVDLYVNIAWLVIGKHTYEKVGYGDDAAIERGDNYIDKILEDMFENNEGYDPYEMEDSVVGFHRMIAFVNVTGEAKLYDGYIQGLKTIHRSGHCSMEEKNGRLHVKAELGAGVLDFSYSASAEFMNFGPKITVEGELGYVDVYMEFNVDSETGKDGKLIKFIIDDMRRMEVQISGLGPLNWAVNSIISTVPKIFKRLLRNFIQNKVEAHIAEYIPNFQFPVDNVVTEPTTKESNQPTEPTTQTDKTEQTEEKTVSTAATKSTEEKTVSIASTKFSVTVETIDPIEDIEDTEARESEEISDSEPEALDSSYVEDEETLSSESNQDE